MPRDITGRDLRPTEGPVVEIACTTPGHGRAVIARLVCMPRWDGAGSYWGKLTEMTDKEAKAWQAWAPGDPARMPREYREPRGDGFYWLRDGKRVTDHREARIISNAFHHGAGEHRRGKPVPGILDGVVRKFELYPCRCGKGGGIRAAAAPVEEVLNRGLASDVDAYDMARFRSAIQRVS